MIKERRQLVFTVMGVLSTLLTFAASGAGPAVATARSQGTGSTGSDEAGMSVAWSRFVDLNFSAARIVIGSVYGDGIRELTHVSHGIQDIDPKFSPDGSRLLFERDFPDGSTQIMVVNADGTGVRTLPLGCSDPCAADVSPTWAPDGRHVYFTRVVGPFDQVNGSASSAVLYRSRLDGHDLTRVSAPGIDGAYEDYLATFAPGGYMIFLRLRNADIRSAAFILDANGQIRQLTPWSLDVDSVSVSPARTGPSKDLVLFSTYSHGTPDGVAQSVATVPATCAYQGGCFGRIRYLTSPNSLPDQHLAPAWSPDGQQIVFARVSFVDPGPVVGDIWRMDWNGANQRSVSTSPLFEMGPTWGL